MPNDSTTFGLLGASCLILKDAKLFLLGIGGIVAQLVSLGGLAIFMPRLTAAITVRSAGTSPNIVVQ